MTIPTLRTERLVLRPYEMSDFASYSAFLASPSAAHMADDGGSSAWDWFCHDVASWHLKGFGSLTVTEAEGGRPLGHVGIHQPPRFPEIEMGWFLYDGATGKGFAFEAAAALRAHVTERMKLPSLVSYIDRENAASIRLAERLGARLDPDAARPEGDDCLVYRHPLGEAA
ncbi:GNAT family N-acetyltransferase [Histidinibacterium aquaticum]|uniref:GNAT family N-acetyltransferase n=1 Tax=Histidinibacterium aquaticum TaxID=2613962 RepID=A0A5J5GR76_9RHOB|nr:GNAT family N-acetyltransferase [Histidinibacterium aquaticum]KAA9010595.1 GNAT family N-acetyltransferase [Histidinibacterium aquaticum]